MALGYDEGSIIVKVVILAKNVLFIHWLKIYTLVRNYHVVVHCMGGLHRNCRHQQILCKSLFSI